MNNEKAVSVIYENWRGETRLRSIVPIRLHWDSNQWHPVEQWLLDARDTQTDEMRTFALKDCDFRRMNA